MTASTLKHYVEKPLRFACDPVCVSASGHTLLVDNAREVVIGEILLITLIAPDPLFCTEALDFKLIRSGLCIKRTSHLYFESGLAERRTRNYSYDGGPATFRQECEYSPSRAQRGKSLSPAFCRTRMGLEERQTKDTDPHPAEDRVYEYSWYGLYAISGLTGNFSLLWRLIYRRHSAPEAFRSRAIYTDCTPNSPSRPVTAH